jgi:calcineurin-like phosphoesterase family protein
MDACIIDNTNEVVMQNDRLIIVGDVAFKNAGDKMESYRSRIVCKNVFVVLGNHDKAQVIRRYFNILPAEYMYVHEESPKDFRMVLSHYRMDVWEHSHHGAAHLYGHSHGKLKPKCGPDGRGLMCFDVGVDTWNFKPLSLIQVRTEMRRRLSTVLTEIPYESTVYLDYPESKEHHGVV